MTPSSAATEQPDLLLHAYLDGELEVAASVAVERDIQSDPMIAKRASSILALQQVLREKFPREPIPPHLSSRIEAVVGKRATRGRPTWMLMAASVVAAIALSSTSTWLALQAPLTNGAASELIDGHMRSLAAPQPTDVRRKQRQVAGKDAEDTIKCWDAGGHGGSIDVTTQVENYPACIAQRQGCHSHQAAAHRQPGPAS